MPRAQLGCESKRTPPTWMRFGDELAATGRGTRPPPGPQAALPAACLLRGASFLSRFARKYEVPWSLASPSCVRCQGRKYKKAPPARRSAHAMALLRLFRLAGLPAQPARLCPWKTVLRAQFSTETTEEPSKAPERRVFDLSKLSSREKLVHDFNSRLYQLTLPG